MTKTDERTNKHGVRVTEHICETCGEPFTVCPGVDDWPDCLSDTCASYDASREVNLDIFRLTTLGQRIRARRKQLGLTQDQLSEKCGCTMKTISRLELDTHPFGPFYSTIKQIAKALEITIDELDPQG